MFELVIVIGVGATAMCFLKGYPGRGALSTLLAVVLVGAVVGRALSTESEMGDTTTAVVFAVGAAIWAVAAVWLAWPKALPGSALARQDAVDAAGNLLRGLQPARRRIARLVLGGLLGLLPGVAFIAAITATLEGDEAQLAFLGIPIALIGLVFGAGVGYRWVPRRLLGLPPPPPREHSRV